MSLLVVPHELQWKRGNGSPWCVYPLSFSLKLLTRRFCQQCILLAMKLPAARKKVDAELARVRADIRKKLIPEGPRVARHLALPLEGNSKEWIIAEMARMDEETPHLKSWKDGKISGAIYREYSSFRLAQIG